MGAVGHEIYDDLGILGFSAQLLGNPSLNLA